MNRFDVIESLERRSYFSSLVFSPATSFPTGANPSDIVTADLTGDGVSDVITTDFGSSSIAVLRGNGNGTFQPPVFYAVGNSPEQLAVADFNGDGIPDIVTANEGDNTISILMGNGDGTFQPAVTYAVGVRPEAVAVGDLTGDGSQDIVVADDGSANVDVLINNGNGTFQPAVSYAAGDDPDGVAVGDFNGDERPDIVVINPLGSYLHVLLNNGDGTFKAPVTYTTGQTPRAVTLADMNSDGRLDIITSSLHDTTVDILLGNGDGTFQEATTHPTGFFPFSIAIADMNGDGRPDIVTSNELDNTVSVLQHITGRYLPLVGYHAGVAPVAVATADLNGDGKPDIIAADFNTNSISVLMNQTVFPTLIPTTITLTANQNPVEFGNRAVFTAQVTPTSPGAQRPIGVVQFFNADDVIGVGEISASGTATIYPTKLPLGVATITAHYSGDGVYAQVSSSAILEDVVEPIQTVPLVQATAVAVHLPRQYVPGDRGVADVAITDVGDGPAKGIVGLQLYASTSSTFDSTAFPITIDSSSTARLNLPGGRTAVAPVTFTMPTDIDPVNYTVFAAVTPVSGLTSSQVATVPAVGLNSALPVLEFGRVPTHGNYKLTRTLTNGSTITLSLSSGTGDLVENPDGGISITLSDTAGFGTFNISGGPVTIDYLADNSPIGKVETASATMNGQLALNGSTGQLTLAASTNSNLFIAGGVKEVVLSLGTVASTSLYNAGAIRSLAVNSWSNTPIDGITTAFIGSITSAGDFGPALVVNGGAGPRDLGISSVTVGGTVGDATWSIQRNIGTIQIAGAAPGWSASIHGTLASITDSGDFAGDLAALDIGTVQISGNLTNAVILAGANFGATARLSPTGNVFGRGVLTSLLVSGNVTNSVVAAGLSPIAGNLLGSGTTLLRGSAIKSVTISGTVDDASKFLAVSLPVKASVDGLVVATAGDANFEL